MNYDKSVSRQDFKNSFNEYVDPSSCHVNQKKEEEAGVNRLVDGMKDQVSNERSVKTRTEKETTNNETTLKEDNTYRSNHKDGLTEHNILAKPNTNRQKNKMSEPDDGKLKRTVSVCQQCHKTCLKSDEKHGDQNEKMTVKRMPETNDEIGVRNEDYFEDSWNPLAMLGTCGILPATNNLVDPFAPQTSNEKPKSTVYSKNTPQIIKFDDSSKSSNKSAESCYKVTCKMSTIAPSLTALKKPQIQVIKLPHKEEADISEEETFYKTFSTSLGLRRYGTLNSLEKVSSDDLSEGDEQIKNQKNLNKKKKELSQVMSYTEENVVKCKNSGSWTESTGDGDRKVTVEVSQEVDNKELIEKEEVYEEAKEKLEMKTHSLETGDSIRGWTVRAGSFVAAKMAFFERLSNPDNSVTVRKTTFLERYLKPSAENHLEPSDVGTNTSSSGRGEDEGETSGATSGEEIWGTPTSGDDDHHCENSAISAFESPRESIPSDDDTDNFMEDLLISLPMLAVRTRGLSSRRRLEPLLEEEDSDSSISSPLKTKTTDPKAVQDRGFRGSPKLQRNGISKSEALPRKSRRKNSDFNFFQPETLDDNLGIHSDEEEIVKVMATSSSFLRRFGLKRNLKRQDSNRKCSQIFRFLSGKKVKSKASNRNSAIYGAKPLFRYLFNKDSDDDDGVPTTLPKGLALHRANDKKQKNRFWNQLKKRRTERPNQIFFKKAELNESSQT